MSLDQFNSLPPAAQQAILDSAALAPPNGTFSDFDNPPNDTRLAFIATTLCLVASSLAMIIRVYARFWCTKTPAIEDYLVIAAFGLYVGYQYVTYWLLDDIGFFVHQWDIRLRDLTTHLYIVHIGSNLYAATMLVVKTSILQEWCRIFVPRGQRNSFFWVCHAIMGVNIIFYATSIVVENLGCFPHERIWNKTVPGSVCLDTNASLITGASINIVLDLIILVFPQKVIWGLHLSRGKKIGVSLVFLIGILACASAAARLVYSVQYFQTEDKTYTLSALSLWCIAEMTCMFLIFAGPAIPVAFKDTKSSSRITATVKSWLVSSKKTSSMTPRYSRQNQMPQEPSSLRSYQKIDEHSVPLTTMASADDSDFERIRELTEKTREYY